MKIRSLATVILALSLLGCDHLRSKDASAADQSHEKAAVQAPQSTMPTSGRYGGGAQGQAQ
jgi:hypothetical protein